MDQLPVAQIVAYIITGLLSIVTFFSQMYIKSLGDKFKKQEDEILQNRNEINKAKMEIHELKNLVAMNTEADKHRMETLKNSFQTIVDGIKDIKLSQSQQQTEMKSIDKRLTDFILESTKSIAQLSLK
jgi:hypothetical protein